MHFYEIMHHYPYNTIHIYNTSLSLKKGKTRNTSLLSLKLLHMKLTHKEEIISVLKEYIYIYTHTRNHTPFPQNIFFPHLQRFHG